MHFQSVVSFLFGPVSDSNPDDPEYNLILLKILVYSI